MSINEKEFQVIEYLEGEMTLEQERELLAQVECDPELRALLEEYQQQDRVLRAYYDSHAAAASHAPKPDLHGLPVARAAREGRGLSKTTAWSLAVAAAFVLMITGALVLRTEATPSAVASVVYTEGRPQAFAPESTKPLNVATELPAQVERLKTPAGSQLEVALVRDAGSLEMRENSTVRLGESGGGGVEVELDRGEVILQVKPRKEGEGAVRVRTPHFHAISHEGTFSVVRGLRGAEVGVVSGEVELRTSGARKKLAPGETFSSTDAQPVALRERISWSRHRGELVAMLPEEPAQEAAEQAATPPPEPITPASEEEPEADEPGIELADAPSAAAGTASSPQVVTTQYLPRETIMLVEVTEVSRLLESSGKDNFAEALLSAEVQSRLESSIGNVSQAEDDLEEVRGQLDKVFSSEDLELVLSSLGGSMSVGVTKDGPLVVAEVTENQSAMAELVNMRLEPKLQEESQGDDRLRAGYENGMFLIGFNGESYEQALQAARTTFGTGFADSSFYEEVRRAAPGSYFTAAANAQKLFHDVAASEGRTRGAVKFFEMAGLSNMKTAIAATNFGDQAENQALRITFDGERKGMLGWLDEPGPLSSFQYFSPDTHALLAARVERPGAVFEEWLSYIDEEKSKLFEQEPELARIQEIANTFGNEAAIGLDNPVLPVPNVKAVFEVLDPVRFQELMGDLVAETVSGENVEVDYREHRNHLIVSFNKPESDFGISYAIVDDFVVLGPGANFVRDTVDIFVEGQSLANEYAFLDALPAKSGSYCSALGYVAGSGSMTDAAPLMQQFFQREGIPFNIGELMGKQEGGETKGAIYYAIAGDSRIDLFIEGFRGEFEMSGLIPSVAGWIEENQ